MSDSSGPDTSSDERGHGVVSPTQHPSANPRSPIDKEAISSTQPPNSNAKRLFRHGGGFTSDETSVDSALCHETIFKTTTTATAAEISQARNHAIQQQILHHSAQKTATTAVVNNKKREEALAESKQQMEKMLEEYPLSPSTTATGSVVNTVKPPPVPPPVATTKHQQTHHNSDGSDDEGDRHRHKKDRETSHHHSRKSHSDGHHRSAQTSELSESELTPLDVINSRDRLIALEKERERLKRQQRLQQKPPMRPSSEEVLLAQESERLRVKEKLLLKELRKVQDKEAKLSALEKERELEREREKEREREREKEREKERERERERERREKEKERIREEARERERQQLEMEREREMERLLRKSNKHSHRHNHPNMSDIDYVLLNGNIRNKKSVHMSSDMTTGRSRSMERHRDTERVRSSSHERYRQNHSRLVDEIMNDDNDNDDNVYHYDYDERDRELLRLKDYPSSSSKRGTSNGNIKHDLFDSHGKFTSTTTNKLIENQVLGYRLAEEIRLLRSDLLKEKQEKRLLLVQCDSLQDQLNQNEQQVYGLQTQLQVALKEIESLEKTNEDQELKILTLEESNSKSNRELLHYQELYQNEQKAYFQIKKEFDDLHNDKQYWTEYTTGLEVALKEMTQQSTMFEKMYEEEKQRTMKLESVIDTFRRRNYQCIQDLEQFVDVKSMELTPSLSAMMMAMESSSLNQALNQSTSSNRSTSSPNRIGTPGSATKEGNSNTSGDMMKTVFDVYDKWEFLLQVTKLKLATMEKKLNKAKSHVSKLMNVVHLYEEILPAANHLAENYYDT